MKEARTYKRTQGRPRTTWIDNISRIGFRRNKTINEMEREAIDRKKWKKLVG